MSKITNDGFTWSGNSERQRVKGRFGKPISIFGLFLNNFRSSNKK